MFKKRILGIVCVTSVMLLSIINVNKVRADVGNQGEVRLNIKTYLNGKDQVTHPSVISFKDKWNGYKYWMSYTPYPNGNGEEENPSVAASNDMYYWETPKQMANPIAFNEENGCEELKDSHILYREDLDRIEVWYEGRLSEELGGDGKQLLLLRKYTTDGIHWSDFEIMSEIKYLSPSIVWDGTKYQCWGIGYDAYNTTGQLGYMESSDGFQWSKTIKCNIDGEKIYNKLWHGSVLLCNNKYYFTYIETANNSQEIKCCTSENAIDFKKTITIIKNDKKSMWKRFYRPCMLIEGKDIYCLYGVITENNEWYISMSLGENINNLEGIKISDSNKMIPLKSTVTDTRTMKYKVKEIYYNMNKCFKVELFLLVPFWVILFWILNKKKIMLGFIILLVNEMYCYMRIQPTEIYYLFSLVVVTALESVSIATLVYCISNIKSKKCGK